MSDCCHCGKACEGRWRCNECDGLPLCQQCAKEAGLFGIEAAAQMRQPPRVARAPFKKKS